MGEKGSRTRQMILEKSRELFCERGYKEVAMKDICQRTGLSRGGLYRHFEGTEQIFLEMIRGFSQDQNQEIMGKIQGGVPAVEILEGLLQRYEAEMADGAGSLSLAFCEYFSGADGQAVRAGYEASREGWLALLRYGAAAGEFRPAEPEAVFDLLTFAYQGARLFSRMMELDPETPGRITGAVRLLLGVEGLRLVRPGMEWKEKALAFRQEFFDHGEPVIFGSELLDKTDRYEDWLEAAARNACPETVNPAWVLTDTYFAVDGGEIVGIIDLRHTLNDFLKDLGNCGYSVRPACRRKGYGKRMLRLALDRAREAGMEELRVSVERGNAPSVGVILGCGGVYERSFRHEGEAADLYIIPLGKGGR